jgi:DNA-binding NtrC family response regulator
VALEQSNIILPESLHLADFKRQSSLRSPLAPGTSAGLQIASPPAAPAGRPAGPKAPLPALDFKSLQLVPGGLDDILTSLEGYYLYNALMTAGGNRGRTSILVGISPWRLRMRLMAFSLADLNPVELMGIPRDRFPKPALPDDVAPDWAGTSLKLDDILHAVERQFIKLALENSNDNKTEAANALGLSRRSFQHRIERTGYEQYAAQPREA